MSDLHVLPLRGHDLPPVRLYVRAKVFKVPVKGWTWQHTCDHDKTRVSLIWFSSQRAAFRAARNHMRWCV